MTMTEMDTARVWAGDIAARADTGPTLDGCYAHHPLIRALGTGVDETEARFDLRDLAYEWALGVLERGDGLPMP